MRNYALITGATGGLGSCFANLLAIEGYNLVLVGRSVRRLKELAQSLHDQYLVQVECIACDLSSPHAVRKIEQIIIKRHIPLEILINNAGFGDASPLLESNLKRQLEMIDVNVRALTELTHRLGRLMLGETPAYILNVASIASFLPGPNMSVYFASKAYVKSLSEALSYELHDTNISVSCLCPGPTKTGFEAAAKLQGSKMFNLMHVSEAIDVAKAGLEGLFKGKHLIVAPKRYTGLKIASVLHKDLVLALAAQISSAPRL